MKIGITGKLFIAILSTCILTIITMHISVGLSFERGFTRYIKQSNAQRINALGDTLAEQYAQNGNWSFLRNNQHLVMQIMRSFDQNNSQNSPPKGWRVPFWIVDAQGQRLFGRQELIPRDALRQAIYYQNQVVGWIVTASTDTLTREIDVHFEDQQRQSSRLIVILSVLLAAAVTALMARGLLAPVKRLVAATHQLASGDFTSRVNVHSRDELGDLADDFNQLAITLEKNEHMRREFMADISHELRTPLAILRGELEALQDGVRQPTPETINSLIAEVATLTKLVDDLHQLSLSDRGALAYRKQKLDMVNLLETAIAAFRPRYTAKSLTITTDFPSEALAFGDPDRLMQLFNNLLENSLRYTDAPGELEVSLQAQEQRWILRWQDSAPGVTQEQLSRLFERFYRGENSRNRASGGTGLGLSICQNIVDAHGGEINLDHSPSGGLCITVSFPFSVKDNPV